MGLIVNGSLKADQASPSWHDPDGVSLGDDWHYRVPITVNSGSIGDTIIDTVSYASLLSDVTVTGSFDLNAVRLTRSNGTTLVAEQSFNDVGSTGDIEFILEDVVPVTYYLYFDITENDDATKTVVETLDAPWFDDAWDHRIMVTIDNTSSSHDLTEYQLKFEIDNSLTDFWASVASDGSDVRFVEADGTVADYFIESFDEGAQEATIWVQVIGLIPAAATKTIYLYYGNESATSESNDIETFSYITPKLVKYVLNSQTSGIAVVSYDDGNTIIHSTDTDCSTGTTLSLDQGDVGSFASASAGDVFCATKPFSARGLDNPSDALVPISFAALEFVIPSDRYTNQVSILSPFSENASVDVYKGTTLVGNYTVGSSVTEETADSSSNSINVASDFPVLVTHYTINGATHYDAFVAYPPTTQTLYGVSSNGAYVGNIVAATTITHQSTDDVSSSTSNSTTLHEKIQIDSGTSQGQAAALKVSGDEPIAVIQQADSDGGESTVFLPESELGTIYYLPTLAEYITIACPTVGTVVSLNGGAQTCVCNAGNASSPVGECLFNSSVYAAGSVVEADYPFYLYYEYDSHDDETNVWSIKSNRQMSYPELTTSFGSQTGLYGAVVGTAEGFGVNIDTVEKAGGGTIYCNDIAAIYVTSDVGIDLDDNQGDTIEAVVTDSDSNPVITTTLYDDFTHGDATINDGIYTNTTAFTVPALGPGGVWNVVVKAGSSGDGYDNGYVSNDTVDFTVVCEYQPNAQIKITGDLIYEGVTAFYPIEQIRSTTIDNNVTANFEIKVENAGVVADSFTVTGTATGAAGGGNFTVVYLGTDGVTDVTSQVTSTGYAITGVAAGASETITMQVTPSLEVTDGTDFTSTVSVVSQINTSARDDVSGQTSVSAEDDDSDNLTNAQEELIGTNTTNADSDSDNIRDDHEVGDSDNPTDTDGDGIIDALDNDSDGDGISDKTEAGDTDLTTVAIDTDEDGVPDYQDYDSDGDTIADSIEGTDDDDGDGYPNYQDGDDTDGPNGDQDGDGLTNGEEVAIGTEHDDADSDDDTISDGDEVPDPDNAADTDFDGLINALDNDSDGDTILDSDEAGDTDLNTDPIDNDDDGVPNYLDADSDGDGISDADEAGDALLQTPPIDSDADGIPDYLDDKDDVAPAGQGADEADEMSDTGAINGLVSGGCSLRINGSQGRGFAGSKERLINTTVDK